MLFVNVKGKQYWDPNKEEFIYSEPTAIRLEYSLLSLAKWESKWHVPLFSSFDKMTSEQYLDFIRCMTVTQGVADEVYKNLSRENMDAINTYINDPMTATWFSGENKPNEPRSAGKPRHKPRAAKRRGRTETTAEVIYAQMALNGIPFECEKWHLSRLLTLIRVCQEMQAPPKKLSKGEAVAQQRMLNEQRKARLHTRG